MWNVQTMWCCGIPGTFQQHCSQSCLYSDETTWRLWCKIPLEDPWKCHFHDSKFYNVPICLVPQELVPFILLFIISLLLKNFLTALNISVFRRFSQNFGRSQSSSTCRNKSIVCSDWLPVCKKLYDDLRLTSESMKYAGGQQNSFWCPECWK